MDSDKNRDRLLRERNVLLRMDMRQRAGQDEKLKGPGPGEPLAFVDHLHSVCLLLCGWFA